jgi:hypothetical protein
MTIAGAETLQAAPPQAGPDPDGMNGPFFAFRPGAAASCPLTS